MQCEDKRNSGGREQNIEMDHVGNVDQILRRKGIVKRSNKCLNALH